ncbi:hypothetical protein EEB11_03990 [Pseudotabrizicola sediminis]|uniref:Uncharacterized protein n=1 Tax=Pseudotabrizicola sediminis TaxID=2486418 RepID=A0ABY2KUD0_9RHOB|nr:hypothetical protein EEB11_03990 [Pseudotabrizicola sediminis]
MLINIRARDNTRSQIFTIRSMADAVQVVGHGGRGDRKIAERRRQDGIGISAESAAANRGHGSIQGERKVREAFYADIPQTQPQLALCFVLDSSL